MPETLNFEFILNVCCQVSSGASEHARVQHLYWSVVSLCCRQCQHSVASSWRWVMIILSNLIMNTTDVHYRVFLLDETSSYAAPGSRPGVGESSSPDTDYHHYSPYNHSTSSFLHASSSEYIIHERNLACKALERKSSYMCSTGILQ